MLHCTGGGHGGLLAGHCAPMLPLQQRATEASPTCCVTRVTLWLCVWASPHFPCPLWYMAQFGACLCLTVFEMTDAGGKDGAWTM